MQKKSKNDLKMQKNAKMQNTFSFFIEFFSLVISIEKSIYKK